VGERIIESFRDIVEGVEWGMSEHNVIERKETRDSIQCRTKSVR
jgi:hypothetical protein